MSKIPVFFLALLPMALLWSCQPKEQSIDYGVEACSYCRMNIVDERYGSQLISTTGKTYSFDAIECMLHYKQEQTDTEWKLELVTDFNLPAKLIPAQEVMVVRTKTLPSPMGMYLTAVKGEAEAQELLNTHKGELYSYPEVVEELENLPPL